jgi:hypothetical protein
LPFDLLASDLLTSMQFLNLQNFDCDGNSGSTDLSTFDCIVMACPSGVKGQRAILPPLIVD